MPAQVSNACKFSGGSRIEVRAWMEAPDAVMLQTPAQTLQAPLPQAAGEPSAPPPHWLVLRVADGGRGMSAEQLATCFQAHTAAPAANGGGSGLGLFISRQFATLMGGTLSCMSRPGEGAAFMLRVPLRVLSDEEAVAANAAAFAASSSQAAGVVTGTALEPGPAEAAAAAALDAVVADADAATAASPRKNVPPAPPPGVAGGGGGARQQQPQMLRALFAVRGCRVRMRAPTCVYTHAHHAPDATAG
jgi:hypothetical protein